MQEELRIRTSGSFPRPDNYHITISYFGEVNEFGLERIRKVHAEQPLPKLQITLDHLHCFHGAKGDHIVYASSAYEELAEWRAELCQRYRAERIRFDEKTFLPHVTLVRAKQRKVPIEDIPVPVLVMPAEEILLLESFQEQGKRIYRKVV